MPQIADDTVLARNIRAVVMDVDGVFTNGFIGYGTGSEDEIKYFYARDGIGISLLHNVGIITGIITGRKCKASVQRLQGDLHIPYILQGNNFKERNMKEFCFQAGVKPEECLYIGDDINDYLPMKMAGISAAPADAEEPILEIAMWVADRPGGRGAVRSIVNRLLKAKGLYEQAISKYVVSQEEKK